MGRNSLRYLYREEANLRLSGYTYRAITLLSCMGVFRDELVARWKHSVWVYSCKPVLYAFMVLKLSFPIRISWFPRHGKQCLCFSHWFQIVCLLFIVSEQWTISLVWVRSDLDNTEVLKAVSQLTPIGVFSCYVSFWTWIASGKEFSVIRHNVSHH